MKIKKILLTLIIGLLIVFAGCEGIPAGQKNSVEYSVDASAVTGEILLENFDLSNIKINIKYSSGITTTVDATESMISSEDLAKLSTEGKHQINIKYKEYNEVVEITLVKKEQPEKVTYSLDTSKLQNEAKISEFKLDNLVIVITQEKGDKQNLKVTKEMLSLEDQEKLTKEGEHTITINYETLSEKVTFKLIKNDLPDIPSDAVKINVITGLLIGQGQATTIKYKTSGVIEAIDNDTFGNFYIKDDTGRILVYGLVDANGNKYNELENKPVVGDTVLIEGIVQNYQGEYEFVNATLLQLTKAEEKQPSEQDYIDSAGYYKNAVGLEGTELKLALRTITTTGYKGVSYQSLNTYLAKTDASPNDSSKILLFYTRKEISNVWDSGKTWNKEHVWPRSTGWFGYEDAGCDAHHIRAVDSGENSRRGNKPYGTGSGSYLPSDNVKGDVARIIFYLLVRYSESDSYNITKVASSMKMLLEWNKLDPVDDIERKRNEEVYKIQKNRNPFIDNSDYAYYIWDTSYLKKTSENTNNIQPQIVNYVCIIENKKGLYGLFLFCYIICF